MADIDQIIAGGAGSSSRADFSGIGNLANDYYKGQEDQAKIALRNAFKDGVPLGADGQPDFGAMAKTLFQKGGLEQGVAASNLDQNRQNLQQNRDAAIFSATGGPPAPQQPIISQSTNRGAPVTDAPQRGRIASPQGGSPQGDQPGSIVGLVSSAGIPDELAGPVIQQISAMTKSDPNAALNPDMTARVQQVVQAAAQRMKGGQPQQPMGMAPQPQTAPQAVAPQAPQQQPQAPNPFANAQAEGLIPPGVDPIRFVAGLKYRAAALPKGPAQESIQQQVNAINKASEPTNEIKNYNFSTANPGMDERSQENATAEARGKVQGETYAKKYEALAEAGTKAQQEIPQLQMLQEQMNDPNFFSGAGEKYNFLYKQLKSAVGIDPNASVPQEFLRKATAANVLGSLGALKGLGQIRVAEIGLAKDASAAPNTSVPANKLLTEMSIRTHQRNADIADLAQQYSQKNGGLDAGFDKIATDYGKRHPLFTDAEIKDWRLAIGQAGAEGRGKGVGDRMTAAPGGTFNSPSDVHAAIAAGKLKSGDTFTDGNGKTRVVP